MVQKTYLKTKDACKVKFSVDANGASSVKILGLNNDWNTPVVMNKKKTGEFSIEVTLPKNSAHEFKYLVDEVKWVSLVILSPFPHRPCHSSWAVSFLPRQCSQRMAKRVLQIAR